MQTSTVVLLSALASVAAGQNVTSNWQVTSADAGTRATVCASQIQVCTIDCNGAANSPKNFCNVTTMGWGCGCTTTTPSTPKYMWPVTLFECNGKLNDCTNVVCPSTKTGADIITCQAACATTYNCAQGLEPASHLEVADVNTVPDYNGTAGASTGNGGGSGTTSEGAALPVFAWPGVASGLCVVAVAMLLL